MEYTCNKIRSDWVRPAKAWWKVHASWAKIDCVYVDTIQWCFVAKSDIKRINAQGKIIRVRDIVATVGPNGIKKRIL